MTIKIVIICTALGILNGRLYAQQNPEPIEKIDYAAKAETYRKMRNVGTALTVVGSVLFVSGLVTMYNTADLYDAVLGTGAVLYVAGFVSLGTGIPLWIVGGVNHKKYHVKAQQLTVKIHATPQRQGLTLTYRF